MTRCIECDADACPNCGWQWMDRKRERGLCVSCAAKPRFHSHFHPARKDEYGVILGCYYTDCADPSCPPESYGEKKPVRREVE